jgi:cyclin-dependent kinase regulatory subunit CKS1
MTYFPEDVEYSEIYNDDTYEYRHVVITKFIFKFMPKNKLLEEKEWRSLCIQQSRGWEHYQIYSPEPHILLFRRPIGVDYIEN